MVLNMLCNLLNLLNLNTLTYALSTHTVNPSCETWRNCNELEDTLAHTHHEICLCCHSKSLLLPNERQKQNRVDNPKLLKEIGVSAEKTHVDSSVTMPIFCFLHDFVIRK